MAMHVYKGFLPWTRSALVTLTARATATIKERNIILKSEEDFHLSFAYIISRRKLFIVAFQPNTNLLTRQPTCC